MTHFIILRLLLLDLFLWLISQCLSLAYRKVTDFCMLILYPESLLKVEISSRSFMLKYCLFYEKHSVFKQGHWPSIFISSISFSCLVTVSKIQRTILNKSIVLVIGILALFLILMILLQLFLHLSWHWLWGCRIHTAFIMLKYSPFNPSSLGLSSWIIKRNNHMAFVSRYIYMIYYIFWVIYVEILLHPRDKVTLKVRISIKAGI